MHLRSLGSRLVVLALAGALLAAALPFAPARAESKGGTRSLPGTQPAWATRDADAGAVSGSTPVEVRLYLAGRDSKAMAGYARAVSDPADPLFHHYLTPSQFQRRFGPTQGQVHAVTSWLLGSGWEVTAVTSHYVAAEAPASTVPGTFGTTLHRYRTNAGMRRGPDSAVSLPTSVAGSVLTVTGLSDELGSSKQGPAGGDENAATTADSVPCSPTWGAVPATGYPDAYGHPVTWSDCGLRPGQLRHAYGVDGLGLTGQGQSVAVVDGAASPTIVQDVDTYSHNHGEQPLRPGQLTQNEPPDVAKSCQTLPSDPYLFGEESLDVEAVHAMAPDAGIVYVAVSCDQSQLAGADALTRIVDGHLADIVTSSWGIGLESQVTADVIAAYEQVFEQGGIEGIGFYFSAGDGGDFSATTPDHRPAVQYPASDPWVTAVGGTILGLDSNAQYDWELPMGVHFSLPSADRTAWVPTPPGNFAGGGGGGVSTLFDQPFYQHGSVPASLSTAPGDKRPQRVIPDISAQAESMQVGFTTRAVSGSPAQYQERKSGGTSLSAPLIAGMQADAQQAAHGTPIGFANPAIYARYLAHRDLFHDVTDDPKGLQQPLAAVGDGAFPGRPPLILLFTYGTDSSLRATYGYDDATGVGSPDRAYLNSYRRAGR